MNAVLCEPRAAAPALPVSPTALHGVHLLGSHSISYPPQVEVTDVLEVDFDQQRIGADGLYLITYPSGWGGCRRFCRHPGIGLQIYEGDKWNPINDGHRDMQVVGRVLNVYRRTQ